MRHSRVTYTTAIAPVLKAVHKVDDEAFRKMQGVAALKEPMQYTGNNMLGIATMHKSNAVPVFSSESAKDISKMNE